MRVLFDHGTPAPLRQALPSHTVSTAFELGWTELDNGALLEAAEPRFDVLVTTDKNLRYQQNPEGRRLAILVLPTTSWPKIRRHATHVAGAGDTLQAGDLLELTFAEE